MRRGELWWVEFDPSVGSEIRKTRPAVIVSNDAANRNLSRVVVVPVTSNTGQVGPDVAIPVVLPVARQRVAAQIRGQRHIARQQRDDIFQVSVRGRGLSLPHHEDRRTGHRQNQTAASRRA